MHVANSRYLKTVGGLGVWLAAFLAMSAARAQPNGSPSDDGAQVLTRGPVHEAFANLSESETEPGEIYRKGPPDDVEELPPDQRPEGDNVSWIPGYWSWDDDRSDYIWVSGVWRDIPPNRQWVPGYWTSVTGGSQFVSGFWSDATQTDVEYLPQPPVPLEVGPSSPPASANVNWAPGSWVWTDSRYAWQPGYWVPTQPNWVWMPAHYIWTPRGYVFVSAFWDYDINHRGVMFAPVYYSSPIYRRPDYRYSPSIVIDLSFVLGHFFVQSRSHHYYYGDYYDARYRDRGYEPWYTRYDDRRGRYYRQDPLYVSYRSQQITRDRDWDKHVAEQYTNRREHVEARPPQTYAKQVELRNAQKGRAREELAFARPLDEVVKSESSTHRFTPVDSARRTEIQTRARDVSQFRSERKRIESEPETAAAVSLPASSARGPASTTATPQRGPSTGGVQTQRGGSKAQPKIADAPKSNVAPPSQQQKKIKQNKATGHEPNQTAPGRREVAAKPDVAAESAKSAEHAQPVRKTMRQSPIAAQQAGKGRAAPPAPDIPKPEIRPAAPQDKKAPATAAEQKKSKGRVGKAKPGDSGQKKDTTSKKAVDNVNERE